MFSSRRATGPKPVPMLPRQTQPVSAEIAALVEELRAGPLSRALFEDHERFVAIADLDGVVAAVNAYALDGTGLTVADYVGGALWESPAFAHDPTAEGTWRTHLAQAIAADNGLHFDDEYAGPDGETVAVRAEISVIRREPGGLPIGFVVQGTNIDRARKAERRLREQERLGRLTFDQSYQLMAVLDPDGTIREVNAALSRMGIRREQVIGTNIVDFAQGVPDGESRGPAWEQRLRAIQTATRPIRYSDTRPDLKDGPLRAVDCTLTPVRSDETGELDFLLFEVHDRTDSYDAELRLRRSEERLRSLAEAVPQMLWIASEAKGVEYFSPRWAEFTGRPIDELLGVGYIDLIHPDDRDAAAAVPEVTDGSGGSTVFRLRRHDGEYRWVESRARATLDEETGQPIRWFGGTLDVTDQRQAITDANTQQQQLQVALDLTGLGRFDLQLRAGQMVGDDRLSEILGVDAGQLMAEHGLDGFIDMIEPDHQDRVRRAVEQAIVPGGPRYDVVYPFVRPSAEGPERRWVAALGRVEFDADGPVRMVGVLEDVTDKRLEDEARIRLQKLEAMGTLAGGIAHDFNNVIGAILSYARVAEAELAAGASPAESIGEIARGALRAGDLTKRLLTFAREEPVRQVAIDLGEVVREAVSLVRPTMPRGTEVEVAVASELPTVLGDSTQLHQVVVNLVTNAGQALAGRERGLISVSVEEVVLGERRTGVVAGLDAGEYLRLRVVDDGPGIAEAIVGRVFDPFFTTKGPNEGTGLGLAAVHSIIRNHRGVIAAEQHRAGGAALTAYLPVQSSPETPEIVPQPAKPASSDQPVARVLFVDDEEALVRLAYRAMPYCGCEVTGFTDPLEAAEAFAATPDGFDAVVTDLSMPGLTGLELTERVRAIRGDVPVVLTSGYMASGDQADAERRGVSAILPKPCSIEDLAGEVLRLLAR